MNFGRKKKDWLKKEMRELYDLTENAHFQLNQIDWEKNVKDFTDKTYECLHNDMTDIINVS